MANLAVFEGIRLPDTAVPLDHPIVRSLLGDQVQCPLKGLARRLGAEGLLGSLQLRWIQSGRHLNKGHDVSSCLTDYRLCRTAVKTAHRPILNDECSSDGLSSELSLNLAFFSKGKIGTEF